MDLPNSMFVKPVENGSDVFAFNFPFDLDAKALEDGSPGNIVETLDDGDLIIEGWAATFDGVDRQNENFTDGAFQKGVKAFLGGPAALCFHHKHSMILGKVLDLEEVEGKGLRMRARVDGAIKDHPELGVIYNQIKRGTLTALSVGGFFKRKMTAAGQRICDVDFTEISITGVPMHTSPSFAVVAGKALEEFSEDVSGETPAGDIDTDGPGAAIAQLNGVMDALSRRYSAKAVKGDPEDVRFLALLLKLEQSTNGLATKKENGYGAEDDRIDALVVRVKNYLDGIAREVHALAAELGPLPNVEN
jgi:HK97 family phage prohead protease